MTERDTFVRRICEEPFEDTHRLVFADWLGENGYEGWAYLVRQWGQPTVCPVGMSADVSFYPGPSAGTHYTVKLHEGRKGVQYVVRRGFVDEIRVSPEAIPLGAEYVRDLFSNHPIVRVMWAGRNPPAESVTYVAWGRELAGLPPLTPTEGE